MHSKITNVNAAAPGAGVIGLKDEHRFARVFVINREINYSIWKTQSDKEDYA